MVATTRGTLVFWEPAEDQYNPDHHIGYRATGTHHWVLVHDPVTPEEGGIRAGARFAESDVAYTLAVGNWDPGTIFELSEEKFTVTYHKKRGEPRRAELRGDKGTIYEVENTSSRPILRVRKEAQA